MKKFLMGAGMLAVLGAASSGCNVERKVTEETTAGDQHALTLMVPSGTSMIATLDRRLSTETNRTGDPIALTTVAAIVSDGRTIVPIGSAIRGTLRDVEASGRASGRARMTLTFGSLTGADGRVQALYAAPLVLTAGSGTSTNAERIAASEVIGTVVGNTAADSAGVTLVLATQGEELVLERGQKISVTITSPMSVEVAAR